MTVTTTTSGTQLIRSEVVDTLLIHYQYEDVRLLPFARFKSLVGMPGNKARFTRRAKASVTNPIANETTSLTPAEYIPTKVDVTVARAGLAREPSESFLEDTELGRAAQMEDFILDAARLLGEAAEDDFTDEFSNASNSVSNAGSALTIANLISAMGKQRSARVRGPHVFGLGHFQLEDLQAAQAAATSTPWTSFYQPNADGSAFGGFFMGHPIFSTDLVPTANTAANRVGAVWARGDAAPAYAAFAYVVKRPPTMKQDTDVLKDTEVMAFITRYGVGTPATNFATSITSRASA